jgi:hypothetical protein
LSELIPDYSPAHNYQTVSGVDLAPVKIHPSRWLWRIEAAIYVVMAGSASIAIFPFLHTEFYWSLAWLAFLVLVVFSMRSAWKTKNASSVTLSVTQNIWRIKKADLEFVVAPCDEMLLWSGVIILPVRDILSGKRHRMVALQDSMNAEDWRRLRVWLRMGIRR